MNTLGIKSITVKKFRPASSKIKIAIREDVLIGNYKKSGASTDLCKQICRCSLHTGLLEWLHNGLKIGVLWIGRFTYGSVRACWWNSYGLLDWDVDRWINYLPPTRFHIIWLIFEDILCFFLCYGNSFNLFSCLIWLMADW